MIKNANTKKELSRQSSDTKKPNAKLVLVSREPLLYLEFNKHNKQNVYEINAFNRELKHARFWDADGNRKRQFRKLARTVLSPRFLYYSSLMKKSYLAM